jgi:ATP/maltotriose-dependent transcriptional regulator MalT
LRSPQQSLISPGGFGKSQIAIEYAHRHASEFQYIWWVNAESAVLLQED